MTQVPTKTRSRLAAAEAAELERRLIDHGGAALDDRDCLQLLAGVAEPAAAGLLAAFGSLPEALGAPAAELQRVVGRAAAARLMAAKLAAARALSAPLRARDVLSSHSAVASYLQTRLIGAPREEFRVLFLDKRNRLIADELMGRGTVDHAPVYPREVVRRALELNASAMILAHNHPGGDPTPSAADIQMTQQVVAAAQTLGLAVHDHMIVAGQQVASLRALGVM